MRRKSTRTPKKLPEKAATTEAKPRRSRRTLKKVLESASDSENDEESTTKSVRSDIGSDTDHNKHEDSDETETNKRGKLGVSKRPRRGRAAQVTTTINEDDEETENGRESELEQDGGKAKGKSKSNNKSKTETSNIEPETRQHSEISENVQVTPQSPTIIEPVDNVNVQNAISEKNDDAETRSDVQESVADTEGIVRDKEIEPPPDNEPDQTSSVSGITDEKSNNNEEAENDNAETLKETAQENTGKAEAAQENAGEAQQDNVEQVQQENTKSEEEKHATDSEEEIKDKTDAVKQQETDAIEQVEEKAAVQENTTKEQHKEESVPEIDNNIESTINERNQKDVDEKATKPKDRKIDLGNATRNRRSSAKEEESPAIEPPLKPAKRIKLNRTFHSLDSGAVEEPVRLRKRKWSISKKADVFKVDLMSLKEVCPDLEFPKESDIKLNADSRRNSHISNDGDKQRRSSNDSEKSVVEPESPIVDKNIIALNRKISIVDDTASKLRPPPIAAKNPVSEVLFITNLVRPFTLKALKELLERTGKIRDEGFWTNKIKSKCMVEYENVEEAEATRNALHGIHWPIGNGKKLDIDYSTKEELEKAINPPLPAPPVIPEKQEKENKEPAKKDEDKISKERSDKKRKSDEHVREWDVGKEERRRSKSRERIRRHSRRSASPVADDYNNRKHLKVEEVPQKLMDDLFLKTKSTPSIYWQPLTPDEIAMKQEQRNMRMEEHKRRMEENHRLPVGRDRGDRGGRGGGVYRRRYD